MKYKFNNSIPIYIQIVDIIKSKIISGEYKTGSQLDSIRNLALEFEINPNTIQRAFLELENSNLVYSQRTKGRFVTEDEDLIKELKKARATEIIESFIKSMKDLGFSNEEILYLFKEKILGGKSDGTTV